jgi:hypothetical protein
LASASVAASAPAHAAPPCAKFDVCQYQPNPYWNGPLMPTWDIPGNYGVGGSPSMCCDGAESRAKHRGGIHAAENLSDTQKLPVPA